MQSPLDLRRQDLKDVIFIGTVVANNDESKMGRVQIRVPHVFDGVPDEDLPWAIPDRMGGPAGNVGGSATCMIPNIGSKVHVAFQMGNPHDPIYSNDVLNTQFFASTIFGGEYPNAWGFSDGKNYIKVNRSTGDIKVHNEIGSEIHMAQDGTVNITVKKDLNINVDANSTVNVSGNASVIVAGSASVEAADITATSTSGDVTIDSAANVTLNAAANVTVQAGGPISITNGAASVTLVGPNVLLN